MEESTTRSPPSPEIVAHSGPARSLDTMRISEILSGIHLNEPPRSDHAARETLRGTDSAPGVRVATVAVTVTVNTLELTMKRVDCNLHWQQKTVLTNFSLKCCTIPLLHRCLSHLQPRLPVLRRLRRWRLKIPESISPNWCTT